MNKYRLIELLTKDLTEWTEEEILQVVREQFEYARQTWINRKTLWLEQIKLYLNQFRKTVSDIQIGSKLIFTQFHEIYSSLDNDVRRTEFKERKPEDIEKVKYANAVADFDFDEMEMGKIQRELNWDILFYGTGILDVSLYDTARKILVPTVQSPFTFFLDPKATSIENARFAGRFIYKTPWELLNNPNLDESRVKKILFATTSSLTTQERLQEQKAKQILMGDNYAIEPLMNSTYQEILEWYFYHNQKLWVVWTDNGITTLLGFQRVDYRDKGNNESKIPFILYYFVKTNFSAWGIGIPDLIEDNHRADVILKNFMLKGIIMDAVPQFLVNFNALINPKDLLTREIGKNIFTHVPPQGQIVPFPKSQVVSNDTLAFMNILQNEAVGAIGSARILRGSLTQVKKTATEIAIAKAKQDLQLSSIMRNILEGEKDFWNRWLKRHKRFLKPRDTKLIKLVGYQGAESFVEVKKSEFIPEVDPDIRVISSLLSEPNKIIRRREIAEILPILGELGGNTREALKILLYDMDFTPHQVEVLLPPTPHELKAKLENEELKENNYVEVMEEDDDLQHIAIHYKVEETEARNAHIYVHYINYLKKQGVKSVPKKDEEKEKESQIESLEFPSPEEIRSELTNVQTEGIRTLLKNIEPSTPSEVK